MNFYFDSFGIQNLSHVPEIAEVRNFRQFRNWYETENSKFVYSTEYTEPGVYLIEISKLTHQWTDKNSFYASFNIFDNLPQHVIDAVKNKTIRIVILNVVEGDNYKKGFWDGFAALTNSIKKFNLPTNSVLIASGNVRAAEEYQRWCKFNKEHAMIEFIGATEGLDVFPIVDKISARNVLESKNSLLYSSLNRAHRQSRTEHLFYLAYNDLLSKGLVSGGTFFEEQGIHNSKFLKVDEQLWLTTLKNNYPKSIDFDDLKNINPANNINLEIYNKCMLSVVSETYFDEPGLYFSEKIFKPISVGSPQLVLGQAHAISYIKDKFNIDLNFSGIDSSFDEVENHKERFIKFHETLHKWVTMEEVGRKRIFINLFGQLEHNLNTLRNINFKKIIVDDIVKSTEHYLKEIK